jgi:AbrB family looped-hinge helix DNA binding protein
MKVKIKVGSKGQVVIPKIIRESIGIKEEGEVVMEVKEKSIEIRPLPKEDLVETWRERANKHGDDVSQWIYGDHLYEEIFG